METHGQIDLEWPIGEEKLLRKLSVPSQGRIYYIRYAFKSGWSIERVNEASNIDRWFLDQIKQLVEFEQVLISFSSLDDVPRSVLFEAKQLGYADAQLANLYLGTMSVDAILQVRRHRQGLGIEPVFKLVDTCAAEFEATTPYYYSTYETPIRQISVCDEGDAEPAETTMWADDEIRVSSKKKMVILGGGPNRIGQGIEFDYCCVQAAFAAKELGFESIMVNSNPETVSTDYDTSDLLFFEPLTLEDVLNIVERLSGKIGSGSGTTPAVEPETGQTKVPVPSFSPALNGSCLNKSSGMTESLLHGVIVQFGGQTPLNLAHGLEQAGVPVIGTSVDSIDLAEDRERFQKLLHDLQLQQPENGIAFSLDQAVEVADRIGYPVLVRPSYVLGGRGMETCFHEEQLVFYMKTAVDVSELTHAPVLIDKFLADATEVDVDVVADFVPAGAATSSDEPSEAAQAIVCGVMEHIEEAGVHSGDSACAIPPHSLPQNVIEALRAKSRLLAEALRVRGLMNVQFAIKRKDAAGRDDEGDKGEPSGESGIYILEVNPRASRTIPFVSKATGIPWARIAAKAMAGKSLSELGVRGEVEPPHTSVKESVFPFNKFPGVDVILGPEMRSTGEAMGIDPGFPIAFAKAEMAAGTVLATEGKIFLSVRDPDKAEILEVARNLVKMGFELLTTTGTYAYLNDHGVKTVRVKKISEGRPNCNDLIKDHSLALIINTPTQKGIQTDEGRLRAMAVRFDVPVITTTTAAAAAVQAIKALRQGTWQVRALQDYYGAKATSNTRVSEHLQ